MEEELGGAGVKVAVLHHGELQHLQWKNKSGVVPLVMLL